MFAAEVRPEIHAEMTEGFLSGTCRLNCPIKEEQVVHCSVFSSYLSIGIPVEVLHGFFSI